MNFQSSVLDSQRYRKIIEESEGFDRIFELVKESVYEVTSLRRAGLTLGLTDLPPHIAAYHPYASNAIILNRMLLRAVQKIAKSKLQVNAFVFTVLMHEYLHSLGIVKEGAVRPLVYKISAQVFGEEHLVAEMAKKALPEIFPNLLEALEPSDDGIEVVKEFEKSTITYIG